MAKSIRLKTKAGSNKKPAQRTRAAPKRARSTTKSQQESQNGPTRRKPKLDPKLVRQHERALKAAGAKRERTLKAHEDAVENVYAVAQQAVEAGISMTLISDATGISRQWLYNLSKHRGRANGRKQSS